MVTTTTAAAAAFPATFTTDTLFFQRALDEFNQARRRQGLEPQGFLELSSDDRDNTITRAQELKLEARARACANT